MTDPHLALLDPVPVDAIAETYDQRALHRLSDAELVAAVTAVVAEPREGPADSFVLHSPLELAARTRLLDRTEPELRPLARLRLVSIAARYQSYQPADLDRAAHGVATGAGGTESHDPLDQLLAAIDGGDLDAVDRACRRLVSTVTTANGTAAATIASLLDRLAPAVAARTAAAAHAPIFLAALVEQSERASGWLPLLRPLARELARHPDWALGWIDDATMTDAQPRSATTADIDALAQTLADPPRLGVPGSSFIHPLLMQVDAAGVADRLLGPFTGGHRPGQPTWPVAARTVLRLAALAMVRDDPAHAPYGWTHCLTLPQAVLILAPQLDRAGVPALAIAATQVLAFRAAQGSVTLDPADPLLTPADAATAPARRRRLVSEAARRHDAHIAKYLLAVLSQAEADPEASELFLTAGEHLLAVWDDLGPDPDEVLDVAGLAPAQVVR